MWLWGKGSDSWWYFVQYFACQANDRLRLLNPCWDSHQWKDSRGYVQESSWSRMRLQPPSAPPHHNGPRHASYGRRIGLLTYFKAHAKTNSRLTWTYQNRSLHFLHKRKDPPKLLEHRHEKSVYKTNKTWPSCEWDYGWVLLQRMKS